MSSVCRYVVVLVVVVVVVVEEVLTIDVYV